MSDLDFFQWLEVEKPDFQSSQTVQTVSSSEVLPTAQKSNFSGNFNVPQRHQQPHNSTPPNIDRKYNSLSAQKLYELGLAMEKTIQQKLHPALERLNPTRRRSNMIASSKEDGYNLQSVQSVLYALADATENQTIPPILSGLTTRVAIETLTDMAGISSRYEYKDRDLQSFWDFQNPRESRSRLIKSGINGIEQTKQAIAELKNLMQNRQVNQAPQFTATEKRIQELEYQVKFNRGIAGFFPTPIAVANQLIQLAQIMPHCSILEPSAGKGDICSALVNQGVNSHQIEVCEVNYQLIEILKLKGFNLVERDCLNLTKKYDRIIGNPPFENGQDIDHVRYLYDNCLNDGGILTMITSTSWTFQNSSKKKYLEFQGWFDQLNGEVFPVEPKAFLKSDVPTGVNTVILRIYK